MLTDKHTWTLTRESQEVRDSTEVKSKILKTSRLLPPDVFMLVDAIPHCGQLNITTSTLSTLS